MLIARCCVLISHWSHDVSSGVGELVNVGNRQLLPLAAKVSLQTYATLLVSADGIRNKTGWFVVGEGLGRSKVPLHAFFNACIDQGGALQGQVSLM